ncbi:hypothetical protein [Bacillus sp. V5-8f]|uniref:hypothetical protein n=1 Tax=Bacillus sp. V5-8f TaxID=2053044 RepID=UPI000C77F83C|nr:hypothetical protein [Bacillus sp. V5-8f]PLT32800.1 hypothetical protein CUU64_16760 [Bacillus sp. V5-8f]
MSKDHLVKLLEELCFFGDVEITHTFSKNQKPILSVCCIKKENLFEVSYLFQVTYIQDQTSVIYKTVDDAATAIDDSLNNSPEEAANLI